MIVRIVLSLLIMVLLIIGGALTYRYYKQKQILVKSTELIKNDGVSTVKEITLGGIKQYILIEGENKDLPIVLFLHGGPGQPIPFGVSSRSLFPDLTDDFIAVYWDQRGSGKSFHKDIDQQTMNIEQLIKDTNELVDYLKAQFNQEKIFLVGTSWGTVLGTEMIHRYPNKFYAYIGNGQMVNPMEGINISHKWLKQKAEQTNHKKLLKKLESFGHDTLSVKQLDIIGDLVMEEGGANYQDDQVKAASTWGLAKGIFFSPDYTLSDIYAALKSGFEFSNTENLKKEIFQIDFRKTIKKVDVPIYFIHGKYDMVCPLELVEEYYDMLDAPKGKHLILLEESAHIPNENDLHMFINTHLKEIFRQHLQ